MEADKKKISGNKFFSGFTYDELDEILLLCKAKSLNTGEDILCQDDFDNEEYYLYYVIIDGSVNVIVHNTLLAVLTPGECFGEVSYITESPRSALIKAREDGTQLLEINGKAVDEQGTQDLRYKLMRRIAMALAERLTRANEIATLQAGPTKDLEKLVSAAPAAPTAKKPEPAQAATGSLLSPEEQERIFRENSAKVKLMEASDFFRDLTRAEILEILTFRNVFTKHPDDQKIVSEGDRDRSFFIIIKGSANVMKDGALLKKLEKGDTFGEMSILDGSPRTAHVTADHDCCTIRVDASVLEKASLSLQLKFFKKFSQILSRRLEQANIRR
ncbi:MAG: cyclic nucleotide-binding domain-containing protein [Nitrospinae bacterium]|nr:cyclic nucleotide-binding domain-containing protein [Nitrospinota bacterium]